MKIFARILAPCAFLFTVRAQDVDVPVNQTTFEEINTNIDTVLSIFVDILEHDTGLNWIESVQGHVDSNSLYEVIADAFKVHSASEHLDFASWAVMRSSFERMAINEFFSSLDKPFFIGPNFDPNDGMNEYAVALRLLSKAFPGDRLSLALAAVPLHWIQKTYTAADGDGLARWEGFSSVSQVWWYSRAVSSPAVNQVCEIGFNAGHSAVTALMSNPSAKVVSFDWMKMSYSNKSMDFVQLAWPGRHELVVGDTAESIPSFIKELHAKEKQFTCDVIFIDGGHTHEIAKSDLENMFHLSHPATLVIIDDVFCSSEFCAGPTKAWQEVLDSGLVRQTGCQHGDVERNWCYGYYDHLGMAKKQADETVVAEEDEAKASWSSLWS